MTAGERLRAEALGYVERLKRGPGRYAMTAALPGSPFSDCFAFFVRWLLADDLEPRERAAFVERLQAAQDPDTGLWRGAVRQPGLHALHDPAYTDGQLATFALAALIALGERPRHRIAALDRWPDGTALRAHLDALPWRANPWNSGNRAMQAGILLSADVLLWDDARSRDRLEAWFAWHAERARPATGFWGEGDWADGHTGLGGAAHQHVLYDFWNRTPPCADRAATRAVALQYHDGRFFPVPGGGACDELDAVTVLRAAGGAEVAPRTAVERMARGLIDVALAARNDDGGFCWARRRWFDLPDALRAVAAPPEMAGRVWTARALVSAHLLRHRERRRTAWSEGEHGVGESSMFDTWFRLLTLAHAAQLVDDERLAGLAWRPLPAPNWGFFRLARG